MEMESTQLQEYERHIQDLYGSTILIGASQVRKYNESGHGRFGVTIVDRLLRQDIFACLGAIIQRKEALNGLHTHNEFTGLWKPIFILLYADANLTFSVNICLQFIEKGLLFVFLCGIKILRYY